MEYCDAVTGISTCGLRDKSVLNFKLTEGFVTRKHLFPREHVVVILVQYSRKLCYANPLLVYSSKLFYSLIHNYMWTFHNLGYLALL